MPSQQQLKWSQLRVGTTVVVASVILAVLLFLMSGTTGLFTKRIVLKSYFDNAGGLRVGAPVRLSGVDIGNVVKIRIVNDPIRQLTPVEATMKVSTKYIFSLRNDSIVSLDTAGVLGETYIDIDSSQAIGRQAHNDDVLPTHVHPDFNEVVRSSQSTLQNMDALLKRLDRIVAFVESGKGSIGKLIYDPTLYDRFAQTVTEFKGIVDQVSRGEGSLGALINKTEAYDKFAATLDKANAVIDDLQQGKGTAGKFLKDPSLYNNANDTVANLKRVTDDINAGKGTLGKLSKDEELARKLNDTISRLSELTAELQAGQGTMGKMFKDETLYNNANQMLTEGRDLVKAIRENPKKYLSIKLHIF
ncbi:MAG TPA: MlaD family protein [Candidatus Sulfotelmatobacter sp.]|nr:MlaD family protein [Candidatus Sulfotelmatobacter sp.]